MQSLINELDQITADKNSELSQQKRKSVMKRVIAKTPYTTLSEKLYKVFLFVLKNNNFGLDNLDDYTHFYLDQDKHLKQRIVVEFFYEKDYFNTVIEIETVNASKIIFRDLGFSKDYFDMGSKFFRLFQTRNSFDTFSQNFIKDPQFSHLALTQSWTNYMISGEIPQDSIKETEVIVESPHESLFTMSSKRFAEFFSEHILKFLNKRLNKTIVQYIDFIKRIQNDFAQPKPTSIKFLLGTIGTLQNVFEVITVNALEVDVYMVGEEPQADIKIGINFEKVDPDNPLNLAAIEKIVNVASRTITSKAKQVDITKNIVDGQEKIGLVATFRVNSNLEKI